MTSGEVDHFGTWNRLDYDGDEDSGAILEMGVGLLGYGTTDVGDKLEVSNTGMC